MEYRYTPAGLNPVAVPMMIKSTVNIEENRGQAWLYVFREEIPSTDASKKGNLDITLSSRMTTRVIEKITVEWYLGDGATGASCIVSNNASWMFDPRTLVNST
jgi:AP-3 complex subunit mu